MSKYRQMLVDIRINNLNDGEALYATAMVLYDTKYKQEGVSMIVDFEHGLVNFANEKSCKVLDEKDLFYFLENIGYELLQYSMVKGKVFVH